MGGRPPIAPDVRELIRTMSRDNVGWGAPRIHGELQMLGIHVCQATVAKYRDPAPRYLLRDRDKIFGAIFRHRVHTLDMREVLIAPRSPWQNPYVERLIGSIRRECLDPETAGGTEPSQEIT
jgi:hypothetical protein